MTGNDMRDHNTFDAPDNVTEKAFAGYRATAEGLSVTLPVNSVVEIRVSR